MINHELTAAAAAIQMPPKISQFITLYDYCDSVPIAISSQIARAVEGRRQRWQDANPDAELAELLEQAYWDDQEYGTTAFETLLDAIWRNVPTVIAKSWAAKSAEQGYQKKEAEKRKEKAFAVRQQAQRITDEALLKGAPLLYQNVYPKTAEMLDRGTDPDDVRAWLNEVEGRFHDVLFIRGGRGAGA
ncbi:hypothetical protein ACNBFH_004443 [Salmonella enterica subsp. enterica serovar Bareilly]